MKQTDATTMTRYLLGQLSAAERDACEPQWFTDKEQYARLCEAENALIDDYVRGALPAAQRQLFEQQFLTLPARRERVRVARALLQEIDQQRGANAAITKPLWFAGWWQSAWVPRVAWVATVILLLWGGWAFVQYRQARQQLAQAQGEARERERQAQALAQQLAASRAQQEQLQQELEQLRQAQPQRNTPPRTLLFTLATGALRSEGAASLPTLQLNKTVARVQLQIPLPANDYRQFSVVLQTATGAEVARWNGLRATRGQLVTTLAAARLAPGDYVLILRGVSATNEAEELRRLPFHVKRQ